MNPTIAPMMLLALAAALRAQDVLHYKFDEHCSNEVQNFAPGTLLGNATLTTTQPGGLAGARIPGQFDEALSGAVLPGGGNTWISTGWAPATTTGDLSFAMWIRNHPGNPTSIGFGYLFGADGGNFRLFTGSSGKMFLSGLPNSATSATDLTTLLNAGWTHVACTVDSAALQATWYVNGFVDATINLTSPLSLAGTNFAIGARGTTGSSASPLDTDEFVLSESVWDANEVLSLWAGPRAGAASFDAFVPSQCGAGNMLLGTSGGVPAIGNTQFAVDVSSAQPSLFVLLAGFDRCQLGGAIPLPFDATPILPELAGCWILADAPVTVAGTSLPTPTALPLPIGVSIPPALNVYFQALGIDLGTFAISMSNGLAVSTGF